MSDPLTHECGIAVVRLRKPLAYYQDRYGNSLWGFNKLFLLMEKQRNRGQDGIGIGCCKLNMPIGQPYIFRKRSADKDCLAKVFNGQIKSYNKRVRKGHITPGDPEDFKNKFEFGGEILMGHLRYGTSGEFDEGSCHPYLRRSNWPTRTLMVMGNFNMTNTGTLNRTLIDRGQHPVFGTDTQTVLEEIGFHLDEEHTDRYREYREKGEEGHTNAEHIARDLDVEKILREAGQHWDGGYAICGAVGNGDMFVVRDPHGIRPCYVYIDDEVVAVSSERVPLMTVFEADQKDVNALSAGGLLTVKANGDISESTFTEAKAPAPCSFEKIYFSRGNDADVYQERKAMGAALTPQLIKAVDNDFDNSVFTFIPNTAEVGFFGMMEGLRAHRRTEVKKEILNLSEKGELTSEKLDSLVMQNWPQGEKLAHKDVKLRTFIAQEKGRATLASHVYDITYGLIEDEKTTLVAMDDSIVRGTTLKKSILKILARTNPRKIVIASTAPQIRYPDCYGIDMAQIGKFIAFQAAINLIRRNNKASILDHIRSAAEQELAKPCEQRQNVVQQIYADFTDDEISAEISRMVYPEDSDWNGEVEVIYQTVENLQNSISGPVGDWYFTGNYPTPGGTSTALAAYIAWHSGDDGRAYSLL